MHTGLQLQTILQKNQEIFSPVVSFHPDREKVRIMDFTENNQELKPELLADTNKFSDYISHILKETGCKFGIGGYAELRKIYSRSDHFDSAGDQEPRRLHLGTDIWGAVNTPVMAPLDGIIHSFAFNNRFADYGATIILTHQLQELSFHTLYGHLSLNSLKNLQQGRRVVKGEVIAEFGMQFENGNWPPHLHFQIIQHMEGWIGDYPGVCKSSEREHYLRNCPDPAAILANTWL